VKRGVHVSDERLVDVCVDRTATPAEDAHFAHCAGCADRRARLELLLRETVAAAAAEGDAAFSEDRLATQRTRILQRIDQDGRPARVIAFPAASALDPRPLRARPAARWIAGAAAAGLAIGLLAGHLAHDLPTFGRPDRAALVRRTAQPAGQPSLRVVVNASLSDEEFLGEIADAVHGPTRALRLLNDLTPQ
jgi:hypothetical protein